MRLCRSSSECVLGGVCGGLARYLGVDVTLVRVFFVLLALAAGTGVLLYLAMWVIVPVEGQGAAQAGQQSIGDEHRREARPGPRQNARVTGALLLILGMIFLAQNVVGAWLPWLGFGTLWPLLLILAGGALLWSRVKGV
jgi:phage shock protein C